MLNAHKNKRDHERQPNCETCQAKGTPRHDLLNCGKYEKERKVLFKTKKNKQKNSKYIITLTMEDVLGEQNSMHDDHKSLRKAFEKYINSTKKDF